MSAPTAITGIDASMLESAPKQPAFITGPVASGSPAVGATLSCLPGSWSNNPTSLTYAWLRNGVAIAGQTGSTYTVQSTDEGATLACGVTVANAAGSASQTSNSLAVPAKPPAPAPVAKGKAIAAGTATTKGGKALVRLTCTGSGACKGTLKLVYEVKIKHGKHGKTKVSKVTIGTASFSIVAGDKKTVSVKLTKKGAGYLAKAGKHGLKVALSGSDVKARTLTVKASSKKAKKAKK